MEVSPLPGYFLSLENAVNTETLSIQRLKFAGLRFLQMDMSLYKTRLQQKIVIGHGNQTRVL